MNKTEKSLAVFTNPEFGSVRTVELDGEPWLVGKDVAAALGYKDTINALKAHVDPEDKKRGGGESELLTKELQKIIDSSE